jgi:hypothetical protein
MFVSGLSILSALVLVQAGAEFEPGARFESRAGEAPTGTQTLPTGQIVPAEQAQLMVVATPILGLHWLSEVNDLRANSATRILWRPEPLPDSRPLFLETIEATHIAHPSPRTRWQLSLRGSYGEEDYTSLSQQFANQPTLPTATTAVMVNGLADASWRSTRRTTLTLQLGGFHRRALDGQTVASSTTGPGSAFVPLPTQTSATATPGMRFALTRRTSLEAFATIADADIQGISPVTNEAGRTNVFSVQPQVGILQELSRSHQLHLLAGLTYAAAIRRLDASQTWHPVTPIFAVDLRSVLRRTRDAVVRSSLGAGTTWYADPVLGVAVVRGIAQANLDAQLGLKWTVGIHGTFATDLTRRLPTVNGGIPPDETIVSAEIPFRYRWSEQWVAEFGGRLAERGPHLATPSLAAPNFALRSQEREMWVFLTLLTVPRAPSARPSPTGRTAATP